MIKHHTGHRKPQTRNINTFKQTPRYSSSQTRNHVTKLRTHEHNHALLGFMHSEGHNTAWNENQLLQTHDISTDLRADTLVLFTFTNETKMTAFYPSLLQQHTLTFIFAAILSDLSTLLVGNTFENALTATHFTDDAQETSPYPLPFQQSSHNQIPTFCHAV